MNDENIVALYCRISGDDGSQDESISITNQKQILQRFVTENNFTNYRYYVDERKTGTNFDRPAWQEIDKGIREGKIKTVIVKDTSRIGRHYIKVGEVLEIFFPKHGVRFISVSEGIDTQKGEDEMSAFRGVYNEYHSKETSRKLRASHINKAKNGGRVGGRAPYGYIKDENNKLIIDPEIEGVIKFIFESALNNQGPGAIAKALTDKGTHTPSALFFERTGIKLSTYKPEFAKVWQGTTIGQILQHEVYIGNVVNFKTTTPSHRDKTKIYNPPEKQIRVENCHPAIIDKEIFEIVQTKRKHRKPVVKKEKFNLFADILYCKDCGSIMTLYNESAHNMSSRYYCMKFKTRGKYACTSHHITADNLMNVVVRAIQEIQQFSQSDETVFRNFLAKKLALKEKKEEKALEKEIFKIETRLNELPNILKSLYEDKALGKMDEDLFSQLSSGYLTEQKGLRESLEVSSEALIQHKAKQEDFDSFTDTLKQYTDITRDNLTPHILNMLIERIDIGQRDKPRAKDFNQDVDIYFRGIGMLEEVGNVS